MISFTLQSIIPLVKEPQYSLEYSLALHLFPVGFSPTKNVTRFCFSFARDYFESSYVLRHKNTPIYSNTILLQRNAFASLTVKRCIGRSLKFCEENTGSETGFTTRRANAGMSGLLTNSEEIKPCGLYSTLFSLFFSFSDCFCLFEAKAGSTALVPSYFLFDFFSCEHTAYQKGARHTTLSP